MSEENIAIPIKSKHYPCRLVTIRLQEEIDSLRSRLLSVEMEKERTRQLILRMKCQSSYGCGPESGYCDPCNAQEKISAQSSDSSLLLAVVEAAKAYTELPSIPNESKLLDAVVSLEASRK